jgi:transposase-like protein
MRKLLKKYGFVPDKLVTDELRSYAAAASHLEEKRPGTCEAQKLARPSHASSQQGNAFVSLQ